MSAGKLDITYECGMPQSVLTTFEDQSGVPVSLLGYTAKMQIREYNDYVGTPVVSLDSATGGITVGSNANFNNVDINLPSTIPAGSYTYDLFLEYSGTPTIKYLYGAFNAVQNVTQGL